MSGPASVPSTLEFEAHRPYLLRFALLHLRDRGAAEDAVQETYLAAIQGAEKFGGRSALRTWLVGILKHKIMDQIRKTAREPRAEPLGEEARTDDIEALFADDGHFLEPPGEWIGPETALEERRFFEALERCLEGLPKNTARAFLMREVMGLETGEICKELGISPSNCWVLLHRARLALRACLERTWFLAGAAAG